MHLKRAGVHQQSLNCLCPCFLCSLLCEYLSFNISYHCLFSRLHTVHTVLPSLMNGDAIVSFIFMSLSVNHFKLRTGLFNYRLGFPLKEQNIVFVHKNAVLPLRLSILAPVVAYRKPYLTAVKGLVSPIFPVEQKSRWPLPSSALSARLSLCSLRKAASNQQPFSS